MKNSKHIYFYSAGAILLAFGAYIIITRKSEDSEVAKDEAKPEDKEVQTSTGSILTLDQLKIPENLSKTLDLDIYGAVKQLGNKDIYSKLNGVNVRTSPSINNGIVGNSLGAIDAQGTYIGKVKAIANDNNNLTNIQGRTYKWVKVLLSSKAIDALNKSRNGLFQSKLPNSAIQAYVREDTIMLK